MCVCVCVVLQVSKPDNGKDVSLNLVVHSKSTVAIPLTINISVQAMKYNGTPAAKIQSEKKEETLQPTKGDSSSAHVAVELRISTTCCFCVISCRSVHPDLDPVLDLQSAHVER